MPRRHENDRLEQPERPGAMAVRVMLAVEGWSRAQLSEATGYDPKAITHWVRGQREPEPEQLAAVAKALGWRLEFIESLVRSILRLRGRRQSSAANGFAGVAEEVGRRASALVEAAIPEIEALLEAGEEAEEWAGASL